jgi:predicted Zn-dependent protease
VAWFDNALAERKYNSEVAARYGLVASLLRDQQYARASKELAALEKIAPPHPMIEAIAAHVLMDGGNPAAAVTRLEAALSRYPNKLQLVYDYPDALINAGRPAQASTFAEAQLQRFPQVGPLHELAAKAYAEQGRNLKQHQHLGEYYAWMGNLRLAIDQLELAIKAGDANFYESSVVETRAAGAQARAGRAAEGRLRPLGLGRRNGDARAQGNGPPAPAAQNPPDSAPGPGPQPR